MYFFYFILMLYVSVKADIAYLKAQTQAFRCPNFGQLNYTCKYGSYCDIQKNLVCGDGTCGHTCPSNFQNDSSFCFYIHNSKMTYNESIGLCRTYGAELVTVNSYEKFQRVFNNWTLNDPIFSTSTSADPQVKFNAWINAKPLSYLFYEIGLDTNISLSSTWYKADLNNFDGDELCLEGYRANSIDVFSDVKCDSFNNVICEIEIKDCDNTICNCKKGYYLDFLTSSCKLLKTFNESCTLSSECNEDAGLKCVNNKCQCLDSNKWYNSDQNCQKCPTGWLHSNKSCYLLNQKTHSYSNATAICASKNSNLLSLDNENEIEIINSLYQMYFSGNKVWVGYINLETEECFDLASSSIFPYQSTWCNDTAPYYSLISCPYLESHSMCLKYEDCNTKTFSICEANEYFSL